MHVHKGSSRIAIIFPSLHIAVKLPKVYVWSALRLFGHEVRLGYWSLLRNEFTSYTVEMYGCIKRLLFLGIVSNWREFTLYRSTRNSLLEPTYFSLFGLLNIQRANPISEFQSVDLWTQLYGITKGKVFDDSHAFAESDNFTFCDGKLRMIDYGSSGCREVIKLFGEKIFGEFDPRFSWEEEKERRAIKREQALQA